MIEIQLLGRFSLRRSGVEISPAAFGGRLSRRLVRILATRRGELVPRDVLVDALWPKRLPTDPMRNLGVLVSRARLAAREPWLIETGVEGYCLTADPRCVTDVETFLASLAVARKQLAAEEYPFAFREFCHALEIWKGDPLPEDAYEEWAQGCRSRLNRAHLSALEGASVVALAVGRVAEAVEFAESAVALDPLREASNLQLIRSLAAAGDTAGALVAFEAMRRRISEDLGLDPSPEAEEIQAHILRGESVAPSRPRRSLSQPTPASKELLFVGRDQEMSSIHSALAVPGAVVLVTGPSGSGKSRLLTEAGARCGLPFFTGRAFAGEHAEPWAFARRLIESLLGAVPEAASTLEDRFIAALTDMIPSIGHLKRVGMVPLDAESRRVLALEGAVRLLAYAAREGIALFVDDLHWVDATSLSLLAMTARRVEQASMVVCFRHEEVAHDVDCAVFLEELSNIRHPTLRIGLGSLPAEAIHQLIDDPEVAGLISRDTDGMPFTVEEALRGLAAEGLIEAESQGKWKACRSDVNIKAVVAVRRAMQRTVEHRINQQPRTRRALLRLLAFLGREAPVSLLSAASQLEPHVVLEDLEGLARSGLVEVHAQGWLVAHDLIAQAAIGLLDPAERAVLHQRLALALRDQGSDWAEVARHLAGSGDGAAACEAYAEAARRGLARFAADEAEQAVNAGLELDPKPNARAMLLEMRAEVRLRTSDLIGAQQDLRAALVDKPPGPERSRLLRKIALVTSGAEDYPRAAELIDLALLQAGSDSQARAEALAAGAIIDLNIGRLEQAEERHTEALSLFLKLGDANGTAEILENRAMAAGAQGLVRDASEKFDRVAHLFRDSGQLLRVATPRATRGFMLVAMDRAAEGLADTEEALQLETQLGRPEGQAYCLWLRSEALSALGRTGEAIASAGEALDIARRLGHREWMAWSLCGLGLAYREAGELDCAEETLRRAVTTAYDMPFPGSFALARLASVLLAQGDLAGAAQVVERALAEGYEAAHYEARVVHAQLAALRGDAQAHRLADEALALARANGHLASARRLEPLVRNV